MFIFVKIRRELSNDVLGPFRNYFTYVIFRWSVGVHLWDGGNYIFPKKTTNLQSN